MGVVPEGVWARVLVVDELAWRCPVVDRGFPVDGDTTDLELVPDLAPGVHIDGLGREDIELEEAWGEFLEVVCVREEWENAFAWLLEDLDRPEDPDSSE